MRIELLSDEDRPGGWLLLLDRVRQSYVDLEDPGYLEFPYVQALAQALESLPGSTLRVLHLGGGGFTLPRWVEHTRPGSTQIAAEPDTELTEVVATRLPLPTMDLTILPVDGRAAMSHAPGPFDAVVVDAFHGGRIPGELVTAEFFAAVEAALTTNGLLLMNLADLPGLSWIRRVVAAVATRFPEVVLRAEPAVLDGIDAGNVVLIAGTEIPLEVLVGDGDPIDYGTLSLSGVSLLAFVGGARPFTDAATSRSPIPPDEIWRLG